MSLLERYIFKRALILSLSSLGALVIVVWIVQALQRLDVVRTTATAAGNILWIAFMLVPDLAAGVIPFAVLMGAIQALNGLNADSERAVIAASGASNAVVLRPILVLGLFAGLATLFNSHVLGPSAQSAFYNGLRNINADAITLFLQPGRFEQLQDGLVMSVGDVRGSIVSGLFLSDQRDPATDLTYFAKEAQVLDKDKQSYLLLYDGQLHRRSTADGAVSIIQFQTYAFDLASLRPSANGDWIRNSERSTLQLLNPDQNEPGYQERPLGYTRELVQRFSDWMYPIAYAVLAVLFAGQPRSNRRGTGPAMLLGLSCGLVLKALGFISISLVERSAIYGVLPVFLPIATMSVAAVLIARNVNVSEIAAIDRAQDRLSALLARLGPRRSPPPGAPEGGAGPW